MVTKRVNELNHKAVADMRYLHYFVRGTQITALVLATLMSGGVAGEAVATAVGVDAGWMTMATLVSSGGLLVADVSSVGMGLVVDGKLHPGLAGNIMMTMALDQETAEIYRGMADEKFEGPAGAKPFVFTAPNAREGAPPKTLQKRPFWEQLSAEQKQYLRDWLAYRVAKRITSDQKAFWDFYDKVRALNDKAEREKEQSDPKTLLGTSVDYFVDAGARSFALVQLQDRLGRELV